MQSIKSKLRVFFLHLGISFAVAVVVLLLVVGIWYPVPYHTLSGGWQLLLLVLGIDVIVGPMITLLVYNERKGRVERISEFMVIGFLQFSALLYGVWSIFEARPVHVVFEYDRFRVIHARDVPNELRLQIPEGIKSFPITGPTWLGLRPLAGQEKFDFTMQALDGIAVAAQPQLWIPYEKARTEVLASSKPIEDLIKRFPQSRKAIEDAAQKTDRTPEGLRYLPIQGRKMEAWTVLIDAITATPVAYVDVDSF
jgi:hypothetical protein